jgi:hypothetical protein
LSTFISPKLCPVRFARVIERVSPQTSRGFAVSAIVQFRSAADLLFRAVAIELISIQSWLTVLRL